MDGHSEWEVRFAVLPIRVAGRWVWMRAYERRWAPRGTWATDGQWDLRAVASTVACPEARRPAGELAG